MGVEIERKFLLKSEAWRSDVSSSIRLSQGYFEGTPNSPTVRVRIAGRSAYLTVKGRNSHFSRSEFEYEIPLGDAEAMLAEFCADRTVSKLRHLVMFGGKRWEIDEYFPPFAGLFTAEIELERESESFPVPPWLGREVSGDPAYTNGALARARTLPPDALIR